MFNVEVDFRYSSLRNGGLHEVLRKVLCRYDNIDNGQGWLRTVSAASSGVTTALDVSNITYKHATLSAWGYEKFLCRYNSIDNGQGWRRTVSAASSGVTTALDVSNITYKHATLSAWGYEKFLCRYNSTDSGQGCVSSFIWSDHRSRCVQHCLQTCYTFCMKLWIKKEISLQVW